MASANTAQPSNSSSSASPPRICDICEAEMTHLSDLQPRLGGAALTVFRCDGCNNVVSDER